MPVDQIGSLGPQSVACQFDFGPDNEDATQAVNDFLVTISSDPANVLTVVDISNDGQLSYTFSGNQGVATINVQLQDDGGVDFNGIDTSEIRTIEVHVQDYIFVEDFELQICSGN